MTGVLGADVGGMKTALGTPEGLLGVWPTPHSGPALVELIAGAVRDSVTAL